MLPVFWGAGGASGKKRQLGCRTTNYFLAERQGMTRTFSSGMRPPSSTICYSREKLFVPRDFRCWL